jgi:hypothetical protein
MGKGRCHKKSVGLSARQAFIVIITFTTPVLPAPNYVQGARGKGGASFASSPSPLGSFDSNSFTANDPALADSEMQVRSNV